VIKQLRLDSPKDYAKICADLLPKIQTTEAADEFGFKSLDSMEALTEKLAADICEWGLRDRFIELLSNRQQ